MTDTRPFFESRVSRTEACWLWTGGKNLHGYGQMWVGQRPTRTKRLAHRVAYELFVGPIPDGLELDHLCRVRGCVNPTHLEPVTGSENQRRGLNPALLRARAATIVACPHGHPYDAANTAVIGGKRHCRMCRKSRDRERIQRPDVRARRSAYMRNYYLKRKGVID